MKDIKGYEGIYAVTDDGRVWSYPKEWRSGCGREQKHAGQWLKFGTHTGGYQQVNLKTGGRRKAAFVHRLVAEAFVPNPNSLREVNHIDANKKNNVAENLEWVTRQQNSDHAKRLGLYKRERWTRVPA